MLVGLVRRNSVADRAAAERVSDLEFELLVVDLVPIALLVFTAGCLPGEVSLVDQPPRQESLQPVFPR
jgi:hypothetical protein